MTRPDFNRTVVDKHRGTALLSVIIIDSKDSCSEGDLGHGYNLFGARLMIRFDWN
jgi:hypothetical protein